MHRSLFSCDVLALAFALCPGPPLPWPPHPQASEAHQPGSNLLCTEVATGFSALGTVFPLWQQCCGCLVLPEQLLREGKCPQPVNYRAAPFAHRHQRHGNVVHVQRRACARRSGAWGHRLSNCAVPACPQYKHMLEMGFQLLCHVAVCQQRGSSG